MILRFLAILILVEIYLYPSSKVNNLDIDLVSKVAKSRDAHIMIFLHKNYCGFCKRMEREIESKSVGREIRENFILLSLNINRSGTVSYRGFNGTIHQFAKEFGVRLYPTLIFIDGDGRAIFSSVGYRRGGELFNILKFVSSKSYKSMDLESFKSGLEFEEGD